MLWPQAVDAVTPTPVVAAGGIGNGRQIAAALATGAQGVWMGSLWLTVEEAAAPTAQKQSYLSASSEDTVRTRSWTGKPSRMLKNAWTDAWEEPAAPQPLGDSRRNQVDNLSQFNIQRPLQGKFLQHAPYAISLGFSVRNLAPGASFLVIPHSIVRKGAWSCPINCGS